jgi:hypothetical protein
MADQGVHDGAIAAFTMGGIRTPVASNRHLLRLDLVLGLAVREDALPLQDGDQRSQLPGAHKG